MQVVQDLKTCLVTRLRSLDRLCFFSFCLFRVGQVAFSGRLLTLMRLRTRFVVRFCRRNLGGALHPLLCIRIPKSIVLLVFALRYDFFGCPQKTLVSRIRPPTATLSLTT